MCQDARIQDLSFNISEMKLSITSLFSVPKIAFEGFFTLSCEKNAQKFFAQKISHHKKISFKPVLHFLFYKNFCISNQKTGASKKPICVSISMFEPMADFSHLKKLLSHPTTAAMKGKNASDPTKFVGYPPLTCYSPSTIPHPQLRESRYCST